MAARNFFRHNLPYGMKKTSKGWYLYNRFYKPLGWASEKTIEKILEKDYDQFFENFSIEYSNLTDKNLRTIFKNGEKINLDEKGDIIQIWFYNDRTNPVNDASQFPRYFEILERLSLYNKK